LKLKRVVLGYQSSSVGKGCQKSGCGGYGDCRVVVIHSVVKCKTEGVRRDSVILYLCVPLHRSNKSS
jgi:hypothetical protein